jgi:RimJ/RimL family protein N-acetyltransferase
MFPDLLRDDVFRLETPRLWLRWPRAADASQIARLAGEEDVAEMTTTIPHPYPPGAAAEFVLKARAANMGGGELVLALTSKVRPTKMIGVISLHRRGEGPPNLGYWLGRPFWSKGLMSEAAQAFVAMVFSLTDLAEIHACARQDNAASLRVLAKCGFRPLGSGVETAPARGGFVPVERFLLSRGQAANAEADTTGADLFPPHMQTA